ncbi:unnamed protein product [Ixodes hexagonus]
MNTGGPKKPSQPSSQGSQRGAAQGSKGGSRKHDTRGGTTHNGSRGNHSAGAHHSNQKLQADSQAKQKQPLPQQSQNKNNPGATRGAPSARRPSRGGGHGSARGGHAGAGSSKDPAPHFQKQNEALRSANRRGRSWRGRPRASRGQKHFNGGAPSTAGMDLISFKRAVGRMAGEYERSSFSEILSVASADELETDAHHHEVSEEAEEEDYVYVSAEPPVDPEEFQDLTDEVSKGSTTGTTIQQPAGIGYISVYWDIENCAVPSGVSAYDIVKKVRNEFYRGHREVEFSVACDIGQMKKEVVDELNDAQVTVVHVSSDRKNSADEKLRVKLRRFSDTYKLLGSKIVLITGDVDFASEVHEMRYHQLIHVVLIHNDQAKKALVDCANESIRYSSFVDSLRPKTKVKTVPPQAKVTATVTSPSCQPVSEGKCKDSSVKRASDAKGELKHSVSEIPVKAGQGDVHPETKKAALPETAAVISYTTKVGLLVPKEQGNLTFWKEYLSDVVPPGFVLESNASAKEKLCLVYPSARKAKKAAASLSGLTGHRSEVPVCLGILDETGQPEPGTAVAAENNKAQKKTDATISAHQSLLERIKKKIVQLEHDQDPQRKLERFALKTCMSICEAQLEEFLKATRPGLLPDVGLSVEVGRLRRASPVYSLKSKLLESLAKRQVALLVTSPGSGKSLEIVSYLKDLGGRVLSIQPSDLAAEYCSRYAATIQGLGSTECWLLPSQKISNESSVVFTTARCFLYEFLRCGTSLASFQCIVADELQEDTVYQNVMLALLRKHFISHARLVLCSSALEPCGPVRNFFCLGDHDVVTCSLKFPVDVVSMGPHKNLAAECVGVALEFSKQQELGGNILVFLPSFADAFLAAALLEQRLSDDADGRVRHEVLYDGMPFSLEVPPVGTWKVIFAVHCPDVCVSVLKVQCVIDCGIIETTVSRNGVLIKQQCLISEEEAERRRSMAGVSSRGTCYRLYNDSALASTPAKGAADLRFMEDIILRLQNRKMSIAECFPREPPKEVLKDVRVALERLEAVSPDGRTTELGAKLCHTSLEPRLGAVVVKACDKVSTLDLILLALLTLEDLTLTHTPLDRDGSRRSPPTANEVCMFSRAIDLFKEWLDVPKKAKDSWCQMNGLNAAFFKSLHARVVRHQAEFETPRGKKQASISDKQIGHILRGAFPESVLTYTESGFKQQVLGAKLKVSPLSTFSTQGPPPSTVVCCMFSTPLGSKKPQLLNFTTISVEEDDNIPSMEPLSISENASSTCKVGPIGTLIWNHQFANPNQLGPLEKALKEVVKCPTGCLALDKPQRCIVVQGSKQFRLVGTRHLQSVIDEQGKNLKNKDREALLTQPNSPFSDHPVQAVLGVGGQVDQVLSPAAFRTIVVSNLKLPSATFQVLVNELGNIVQYRLLKKEKAFFITYKTAAEASNAYAILSGKSDDLTVTVTGDALSYRDEQTHRKPAFRATVAWVRRRCTGIGFATLPDQATLESIAFCLPLQLNFGGVQITCDRDKKEEGQLYVKDLPPAAEQSAFEETLRAAFPVTITSARIIHEPPFDTTPQDGKIVQELLLKTIKEDVGTDAFSVNCKPAKPTDYLFKGWVYFDNAAEGQSVCEVLHGQPILSQQGPLIPLEVHALVTESFVFPLSFFLAVKEQIQSALEQSKQGLRPEDNLKVEAKPLDSERMEMWLQANNLNDFQKVVHTFNALLRPQSPAVSGAMCYEDVARFVKALDFGSSVYVHDKPNGIRLLGNPENVVKAEKKLKDYGKLLENGPRKSLPLVGADYGLVKSFVAEHGHDLQKFAHRCGLLKAEFEPQFEGILAVGLAAAVKRAEELLEKLPKKPINPGITGMGTESCPVCRESFAPGKQQGVDLDRLELCGHAYCLACRLLVLHQGPIPLSCCGCGQPWAIADIVRTSGQDARALGALARRSMRGTVVEGSGRWQSCPTPECDFVWDSKLSAEAQGATKVGEATACPCCSNPVCFRCGSLYHYGMSCDTYRAQATPGGASTKAWVSKDVRNRLVCPGGCGVRLERGALLAKVAACWCCRRLFCWRCRKKFSDAESARAHKKEQCKWAV